MTENEAIARMQYRVDTATHNIGKGIDGKAYEDMEMAIKALEEVQKYKGIGTIEECQDAMEIKQKIIEIVNQQLIAGKDNYKEVYSCFYDIVRVVRRSCIM